MSKRRLGKRERTQKGKYAMFVLSSSFMNLIRKPKRGSRNLSSYLEAHVVGNNLQINWNMTRLPKGV